jgi:hypothetical protein
MRAPQVTAEDIADTRSADDEVRSSGYAPELKRTLGPFQTFAISFAFISVLVAVFATYGIVLESSGPVGIWLWIVAAVGQTLVALVVAQFAARIALSGGMTSAKVVEALIVCRLQRFLGVSADRFSGGGQ